LPDAASNPGPTPPSQPDPRGKPRRWRIVAAGLLLLALALVVIYTSRSAFYSPLALVVVAAIGIAALLLQLRLRKDLNAQAGAGVNNGVNNEVRSEVSNEVRAPIWINVLGLMFAIAAVSADVFHSSANLMLVAALGSVVCFAISGTAILRALRKKKI
jgi:peptidoglycan/LPS O-acetylase OafA/YrhL